MSEQALEYRPSRAWDVLSVVSYSILALLVMLLWVYVPAWAARSRLAAAQAIGHEFPAGLLPRADEAVEW